MNGKFNIDVAWSLIVNTVRKAHADAVRDATALAELYFALTGESITEEDK